MFVTVNTPSGFGNAVVSDGIVGDGGRTAVVTVDTPSPGCTVAVNKVT